MQPSVSSDLRNDVMQQASGAIALQVAYMGLVRGLLQALGSLDEPVGVALLARSTATDVGYVERWCEAAFAFGYLDLDADRYSLTTLGRSFLPDAPGSLMPFAIQSGLSAHMADRAARLMLTGERPGEVVLSERADIVPWFGPMLESTFGAFFEREILPALVEYEEVAKTGGLVVDLGCGNGWYLRRIASRFPALRGVGLDQIGENISQATVRAAQAGLGDRLRFQQGDIYHFTVDEPVAVLAMNRALHHVWDDRERTLAMLRDHLAPGGHLIIWEPRWPDDLTELRAPDRRVMAFQNLGEHVQGNHFLRQSEVEDGFRAVGMEPQTRLFGNGKEMVVVGRRT